VASMVRWILELLSLFVATEFCPHGLVRDTPTMVVLESAIPARDGARAVWLDRAEGHAVLASGFGRRPLVRWVKVWLHGIDRFLRRMTLGRFGTFGDPRTECVECVPVVVGARGGERSTSALATAGVRGTARDRLQLVATWTLDGALLRSTRAERSMAAATWLAPWGDSLPSDPAETPRRTARPSPSRAAARGRERSDLDGRDAGAIIHAGPRR
jgi:hypothetical protein